MNFVLDEITTKANAVMNEMLNSVGAIDLEALKRAIITRNTHIEKQSPRLFDFVERIVGEMRSGARTMPGGSAFSAWTIKGYITLLYHLDRFEKVTGKRVMLDGVNINFYYDFIDYFNSRGYALNTVGKHIKNVKSCMALAYEEEVTTNTGWKTRKFKVPAETTDTVYLTLSELETLEHTVLKFRSQAEIRDLFLMSCFLGMRYADLSRLTSSDIFEQEGAFFARLRQQKTGEVVVIPLKATVRKILDKYDWRLPHVPVNQHLNRELKQIARIAGFTSPVKFTRTEGGKTVEHSVEKWQLVTSHTARRTFATNMYLAGVPSISIMKITGHRTEKSFLRYIRISQEDNAMKLLSHPFFEDAKK